MKTTAAPRPAAPVHFALDLGNTAARLYIYKGMKRMAKKVFETMNAKSLGPLLRQYGADACIVSSVARPDKSLTDLLSKHTRLIQLTYKTPLPIKNLYKTPETLGADRIANAAGAAFLYPGKNVLIIDAGTCIKYDFVNEENQYAGGSISPGFQMRYDALRHFTARLPQLKAQKRRLRTGDDTERSMHTGVYNGIAYEMNGFIREYREAYRGLIVVLSGGDASYFADVLNFPIFAEPDLTGIGLNEILRHNKTRM